MPDLLQPAGQRGRDAAGQRPRISKAERPRTWPCKPCLRGTRYGQPARRSCASRRASRSRSGLFRSWMSWRRSRLFSSLLSVKVAAAAAAALTAVGVATAAYAGVLPGSVRRLAHEAIGARAARAAARHASATDRSWRRLRHHRHYPRFGGHPYPVRSRTPRPHPSWSPSPRPSWTPSPRLRRSYLPGDQPAGR